MASHEYYLPYVVLCWCQLSNVNMLIQQDYNKIKCFHTYASSAAALANLASVALIIG